MLLYLYNYNMKKLSCPVDQGSFFLSSFLPFFLLSFFFFLPVFGAFRLDVSTYVRILRTIIIHIIMDALWVWKGLIGYGTMPLAGQSFFFLLYFLFPFLSITMYIHMIILNLHTYIRNYIRNYLNSIGLLSIFLNYLLII